LADDNFIIVVPSLGSGQLQHRRHRHRRAIILPTTQVLEHVGADGIMVSA